VGQGQLIGLYQPESRVNSSNLIYDHSTMCLVLMSDGPTRTKASDFDAIHRLTFGRRFGSDLVFMILLVGATHAILFIVLNGLLELTHRFRLFEQYLVR
jgi:hypothetical protein